MTATPYSHTNDKGVVYYLNTKDVTLRGGRVQTIYYFSRDVREETGVEVLPEGYKVVVNQKTGLPLLKRAA